MSSLLGAVMSSSFLLVRSSSFFGLGRLHFYKDMNIFICNSYVDDYSHVHNIYMLTDDLYHLHRIFLYI